ELEPIANLLPIALERGRIAVALEPELSPILLDRGREGFAERAVVLDVNHLVRELVKQDRRDGALAADHHRAQDRIGEIAEGRVRRRSGEVRVEPVGLERLAKALGALAVEEAAVGDAPGERIAPAL